MSLSVSQIVSVCSAVGSAVALVIGDLSQASVLPAHTAAVVLLIVTAVSACVNQVAVAVSPPSPPTN